jgi:hypothetical protein
MSDDAPTTITIDGREFPIKPTPIAKLVKARALFESGTQTEEGVNALLEALYWGIKRAGGEIELAWLKDNADSTNFDGILATWVAVNQVKRREAGAPGEATGPAS